jgi:hypothetical protein
MWQSHHRINPGCEDDRVSALDLLAVLGAVALVVAVVVFYAFAVRLLSAARRLESVAAEFEECAAPLLKQLAEAAESASGEVERVGHLLDISEGIGSRVEGATGAAYRAITTPAIKGAAIAEGTRRAARRLGSRG